MTAATAAMQSVGSFISICASLPATQDAAGYSAAGLVYKEIGEVDSIPTYGAKSDTVSRTPLKTGVTNKQKGSTNYGSFNLEGGWAPGDVGQAALIAAAEPTAGPVAVKVTMSDGTVEYFTALVMSYERTPGASGDFVKFASMFEVTSKIVSVYPQ